MDVSAYPDVSRLLLVTDLLISDYSSIAGDFMLLGRPTIFYQPDLQDYLDERGLYFDPDQSPLQVAHSPEELLQMLSKPLNGVENCRRVLEFFGTHESGHASQDVAQWLSKRLPASKKSAQSH